MRHRRVILCVIVVFLVISNSVIVWHRFRRPGLEPRGSRLAQLEQEQVRQVMEWESLPVVPLESSLKEVSLVVQDCLKNPCPDASGRNSPISLEQLTTEQRKDLVLAISTLMQSYGTSSVSSLVRYMETRCETLDSTYGVALREVLATEGTLNPDEVNQYDDKKLLTTYWQVAKCAPHWQALVKQVGCASAWRSRTSNRGVELGEATRKLFRNEATFQHIFRPRFSYEDAQNEFGEVLMVDLMVVIQHDSSLNNERCPYFLQFWYSEKDKLWHPYSMKRVSSLNTTNVMIF